MVVVQAFLPQSCPTSEQIHRFLVSHLASGWTYIPALSPGSYDSSYIHDDNILRGEEITVERGDSEFPCGFDATENEHVRSIGDESMALAQSSSNETLVNVEPCQAPGRDFPATDVPAQIGKLGPGEMFAYPLLTDNYTEYTRDLSLSESFAFQDFPSLVYPAAADLFETTTGGQNFEVVKRSTIPIQTPLISTSTTRITDRPPPSRTPATLTPLTANVSFRIEKIQVHKLICTYQDCGKKFSRLPELRRHHRGTHQGHRPYRCRAQSCRRSIDGFPRRDKRDDHERKVHGGIMS